MNQRALNVELTKGVLQIELLHPEPPEAFIRIGSRRPCIHGRLFQLEVRKAFDPLFRLMYGKMASTQR